jgi:DNA-binding XRE family transcriptional regulator
MNPVIHTPGPIALAAAAICGFKPAIPHPAAKPVEALPSNDPFKDVHCLRLVVSHLRTIRETRGVSLREVSRRARVCEEVIDLAENGKLLPSSRIFKSWCRALNLSWDQVWNDSIR